MYSLYLKSRSSFTIKNYEAGQVIASENEICNSIGIVLKGKVQIDTYNSFDKAYNIAIIFERDSFGESLVFSSKPYYLGFVNAVLKSTVAFISKEKFLKLLQSDKDILSSFLSIISNKTIMIQTRLKILSQASIKEKIMFYITQETSHNKIKKIYFKSKEDLARYLNIPRPSLSRVLIEMKKENIIDFDRHYIYLKTKDF